MNREFCPAEHWDSRWPLIEGWPGLRAEIKRAIQEIWTHCPPDSSTLRTSIVELAKWLAKPGGPPRRESIVSRNLRRLQELGLISYVNNGSELEIELRDPAMLTRLPVGTAIDEEDRSIEEEIDRSKRKIRMYEAKILEEKDRLRRLVQESLTGPQNLVVR